MNIQFSVRGRTFNVRTEDDGGLLQKIAHQLDTKINEQASVAKKLDEPSLAIISAMDLLHESALEKRRLAEEITSIQQRLDRALTLLASIIPEEQGVVKTSEN